MRVRPRIAEAVTLLPEADELARLHAETDVVDGVDDPFLGGEVHRQIAHVEELLGFGRHRSS
jgi:hypothetical protein